MGCCRPQIPLQQVDFAYSFVYCTCQAEREMVENDNHGIRIFHLQKASTLADRALDSRACEVDGWCRLLASRTKGTQDGSKITRGSKHLGIATEQKTSAPASFKHRPRRTQSLSSNTRTSQPRRKLVTQPSITECIVLLRPYRLYSLGIYLPMPSARLGAPSKSASHRYPPSSPCPCPSRYGSQP